MYCVNIVNLSGKCIMADIQKLLQGFNDFHKKYFVDNTDIYKKLSQMGQSPKTLIISCSDSRVDPSLLLGAAPGEIFVIRNVANLVPVFDCDMSHCHGTSAAIEYAVKHLKVENIIILGHSQCGGIKTLVEKHNHQHNFIDTWLEIANTTKVQKICQTHSLKDACSLCEKESILTSIENLKTFPFVYEALQNNKLKIHGWYFDLSHGKLDIVY